MTGEVLKMQLQKTGKSLTEIAKLLNLSQQSFSQKLDAQDIKTGLVEELSTALGLPMSYFYPTTQPVAHLSDSGIPYYKDVQVSAGQYDLATVMANEKPVGRIEIDGVHGKYAFPVVGCSMEPVIKAGDIIVVDEVERNHYIDPDKIYLIITTYDRMIKHLQVDDNDADSLICTSYNYKPFSIRKEDIKQLYRVTFYGRLV